ncbi:uncharacterized protein LOC141605623 isoform X2 [Silene latifolia]|uniref:uncharacterized protein LOC141605623 isoform X2 n=1 Tax=Silene latifolia TaxID=37657 RepID=UPI003D7739BB
MDREITTQDDENPSTKFELSPRKPLGVAVSGGGGGGGDRLKRDEWSEGAVTILLEAYESKWILRNRAKLKGQDWEDVAKCVSSRSCNSKSPKTQTQCKNKIESMKKRYRSESATTDTSSWPLYSRLDHLLRGTGATTLTNHGSLPFQPPLPPPPSLEPPQAGPVLESFLVTPPPPPQQPAVEVAENNSQESNDVDPMVKENNDAVAEKLSDQISDKNNNHENHHVETDSSTPALYSNEKDGVNMKKRMKNRKRKRRRRDESSNGGGSWEDVAESIRWVADAVVRSEQARMDTMREVERMRVEAEAKRGEMDLKRTEIIANTQLEIARIFAKAIGKSVDSSLRIGRS